MVEGFLNTDLLILDEIGFKKLPANGMDDFFEIIRNRYENGSMIITTNRNFEDWGNVFGDPVLTAALVDRLTYKAYLVNMNGESYRLKETKK